MGVPFVLLLLQKSPGLLRHILHILSMFKASNTPAIFVDEKLGNFFFTSRFLWAFFMGGVHCGFGKCTLGGVLSYTIFDPTNSWQARH